MKISQEVRDYAAKNGYPVNGVETIPTVDIESEMAKKSDEFKQQGSQIYSPV